MAGFEAAVIHHLQGNIIADLLGEGRFRREPGRHYVCYRLPAPTLEAEWLGLAGSEGLPVDAGRWGAYICAFTDARLTPAETP